VTFPLLLPGYFAGASIVFIWAFTDLGTPLVFQYRQIVPVQIFDMLTDIHENPMGYMLVLWMMVLSGMCFYLSKRVLGRQRYEMFGRGHSGAHRRAGWGKSILIYLGVGALIFLALLPHLSVVLTSAAGRWFLTVLPESYTGEFYGKIFGHELTVVGIRNSLFLSGLSTVLDVVLGILIAYILTRTRLPGRNLLDTLTMLPLAIPGLIVAFGYVASFSGTFLDPRQNPVPLLICAYAIRRLPYMVRSSYAGFQQASVTLEESAQTAGAGPGTVLRRITLPLIYSHLLAGAVLCFAFAMLEVSDSLILAAEERFYPITKVLYTLLSRPDGVYVASAMGVLGMGILVVSLMTAGKVLGSRMGELFRA
jgi:iron(III) transport system permease protein